MTDKCVLVLTNSTDSTCDYLCERLLEAHIPCARYDTDAHIEQTRFIHRGNEPVMAWSGYLLQPHSVSAVIYRRPKPFQMPPIADPFTLQHIAEEWSEAWEGFLAHIPAEAWINHPARNFCASHKVEQLTRARRMGLPVPETLITNDPDKAWEFVTTSPVKLIVKPLASGYIERASPSQDSSIYTSEFTAEHRSLLDKIRFCPVIFQQMMEKEKEVRVTFIDDELFAVGMQASAENGQQLVDIRRDEMQNVIYSPVEIPGAMATRIRKLIKSYRLRFAALDFAIDKTDSWYFFEINPNGQWAWLDLEAGTDIAGAFIRALKVN